MDEAPAAGMVTKMRWNRKRGDEMETTKTLVPVLFDPWLDRENARTETPDPTTPPAHWSDLTKTTRGRIGVAALALLDERDPSAPADRGRLASLLWDEVRRDADAELEISRLDPGCFILRSVVNKLLMVGDARTMLVVRRHELDAAIAKLPRLVGR
jgi:hypothetical protein